MSVQPENWSSRKPPSKRRMSNSRIVRLEERMNQIEEKIALV
jgi:hypothetical protein